MLEIFKSAVRFCLYLPLFAVYGALEVKPWFGEAWELSFDTAYTYSHYSSVDNAHPGLKRASNDQFLVFDLEVALGDSWQLEAEVEFFDTPRTSWGGESMALQVRRMLLDDIVGDPLSVVVGFDFRWAFRRALHDVSVPYHSDLNFELNASLGREWSREKNWTMRTFGLIGVGIANHGYPWLRLLAQYEINRCERHQFLTFATSYLGFGPKSEVEIRRFNGYASIHHQSIDLGAGYRYLFDLWGFIELKYAFRVFSHSFPQWANFVTVSYHLPFSAF